MQSSSIETQPKKSKIISCLIGGIAIGAGLSALYFNFKKPQPDEAFLNATPVITNLDSSIDILMSEAKPDSIKLQAIIREFELPENLRASFDPQKYSAQEIESKLKKIDELLVKVVVISEQLTNLYSDESNLKDILTASQIERIREITATEYGLDKKSSWAKITEKYYQKYPNIKQKDSMLSEPKRIQKITKILCTNELRNQLIYSRDKLINLGAPLSEDG
jgi:hypothetical protein